MLYKLFISKLWLTKKLLKLFQNSKTKCLQAMGTLSPLLLKKKIFLIGSFNSHGVEDPIPGVPKNRYQTKA